MKLLKVIGALLLLPFALAWMLLVGLMLYVTSVWLGDEQRASLRRGH